MRAPSSPEPSFLRTRLSAVACASKADVTKAVHDCRLQRERQAIGLSLSLVLAWRPRVYRLAGQPQASAFQPKRATSHNVCLPTDIAQDLALQKSSGHAEARVGGVNTPAAPPKSAANSARAMRRLATVGCLLVIGAPPASSAISRFFIRCT